MLLHVAETLRTERLPVRVKIVWFDMEELGMIWSAHYVETHAADHIRAMLNFDADAYGDTVLFAPPPVGANASLRSAFLTTCAEEEIDCVRFASLP
jgi:Zn-dependent M28 family amino/carboxypeptidase